VKIYDITMNDIEVINFSFPKAMKTFH